MSSAGVAVHFGDLATADYSGFSACNAIIAVHGGGDGGPITNRIEYVSIPTGGNALDFGDISQQNHGLKQFAWFNIRLSRRTRRFLMSNKYRKEYD